MTLSADVGGESVPRGYLAPALDNVRARLVSERDAPFAANESLPSRDNPENESCVTTRGLVLPDPLT